MTSPLDKLGLLEQELSRLSTAEDKITSVQSWFQSSAREPQRIVHDARTETYDKTDRERQEQDRLMKLMNDHDILDIFQKSLCDETKSTMLNEIVPIIVLPCANVEATKGKACTKEGKSACSACKLVKYCSKVCQTRHWKLHKRDCQDPLRSEHWTPRWVTERRSPAFIVENNTSSGEQFHNLASTQSHLWGNIPAYDLLASDRGSTPQNKDYNIVFAASGDLRNAVYTVNSLPMNYSGHLTVVMNDHDPQVTFRNLLLLMLLGSISDIKAAAELTLHLWYSVCLPTPYKLSATVLSTQLLESVENDGQFRQKFGRNSQLSGRVPQNVLRTFAAAMFNPEFHVGEAAQEYQRVNLDPSRVDYVDRWLTSMEPSHRMACMEYRRFGLALPFGALNAHFNAPNSTLFSPHGEWLQNDSVNPIQGWDVCDILKVGQRLGASREDLYGCFYFFISEQLQQFSHRIQNFRISFYVFDQDVLDLSKILQNGGLAKAGIPSTMTFDRIDVSNIVDAEYVGIPKTISHWGPLLAPGSDATLLGYFMNWVCKQRGGRLSSLGDRAEAERLMLKGIGELQTEGKLPSVPGNSQASYDTFMGKFPTIIDSLEAKYDNSKPFEQYLKQHGMTKALRDARCIRRKSHFILPHRLYAQLGGPSSTLPYFPDKEPWYTNMCFNHIAWSERFVEITRA
ncbi:hypothetical protein QCA50_011897 [Cerrena zonata]|uniref:MYND-type domain-containing protein n=1 Tax=Cerrena zonata TaxID=2478898 RepID=A0AAW0G7U0_9APHY